jgi:GNAT superfamily N-acetyltransferase
VETRTWTYRRAEISDLSDILQMAVAFHQEDGHPLPERSRGTIESLLRGSELGSIYRLEFEGESAGYFALCYTISLEFGGQVIILDDFYLRPEFRSRGLGTEILGEIESLARKRGAVQIFLEVENANPKAFRLYERNGFVKRDRHMMEKNLVQP